MANLVRSRSQGQVKPPLGSTIDWGHPLAQELTFCALFNESFGPAYNLVRGTRSVAPGAGVTRWDQGVGGTRGGPEVPTFVSMNGASTAGFNFGANPESDFSGPDAMSIAMGVYSTNSTADVYAGRDATGQRAFALDLFGTPGKFRFYLNGGGTDIATGATGISNGQAYQVAGVAHPGGLLQVCLNGRVDGTDSAIGAIPTSTAAFWVGRRAFVGAEGYLNGGVSHCYLWRRPLSLDQVAWVAAEPYTFIAPPGPKILYFGFSDGAAGPTNLALSPATIAVTPQALGLIPGAASATLSPATIAVTPSSQGLTQGATSLALSPATLTVTAQAEGIAPGGASVSLAPASVTITPQSLGAAAVVALAVGTATIAVTAAALTTTGSVSLAASPATIMVTAQPLTIGAATTYPYVAAVHVAISFGESQSFTVQLEGGAIDVEVSGSQPAATVTSVDENPLVMLTVS